MSSIQGYFTVSGAHGFRARQRVNHCAYLLTDAGCAVAGRKRPAPTEAEGIQEMDTPDDLQQLLDDGVVGRGSEIAQRESLHHSTVNELLRLTLLEPAIIQSILAGQQPKCMNLLWFQRNPLPTD